MSIGNSLQVAKEISVWLHNCVHDMQVANEERVVLSVAIFQQTLDVADAIVILFENNLPGPAWALARPMHEGYVRGVWLLNHASDKSIKNFMKGKCPNFPELLSQIGDDPESGGAWIKGMTDHNLKSFHDLTHGGMEHVIRRASKSAIEPNYLDDEIHNLLKVRNQYCMQIVCFLLQLMDEKESLEMLINKKEEWKHEL